MSSPHQNRYSQFQLISTQDLEAAHPSTSKNGLKKEDRLQKLIQQILVWMKAILFSSSEIQVWCTYDAQGNLLWNAYDPITRQITCNVSETEIRAWIEQRHRVYRH